MTPPNYLIFSRDILIAVKMCTPKNIPSIPFSDFVAEGLTLLRAAALRIRTEPPVDAAKIEQAVRVYFLGSCLPKLRKRLEGVFNMYQLDNLAGSRPSWRWCSPRYL